MGAPRTGHSLYLSASSRQSGGAGREAADRLAARDGSARLLDALLRYYERRKAA